MPESIDQHTAAGSFSARPASSSSSIGHTPPSQEPGAFRLAGGTKMPTEPFDRMGITRRELLKWGLVSGGAAVLGTTVARTARASSDASPPTTPWACDLPIPPVKESFTGIVTPSFTPSNHQRFNEYPPQDFYEVHIREAMHRFHPDLPENPIWGYDGMVPGPTFHARYGEPMMVRFFNDLPENHVGFGIPETITHLHNAHTASESDGFPGDFYESGAYRDHHYCCFAAGNDEREVLSTLWYHDHRYDFTSQNVYKGLAGFFLFFDEVDSGDETDSSPRALRLPSGEYDIPLMFADKRFDRAGRLIFDVFNLDGVLGDKFTVNGVIQPVLRVARRKYRFRLLDAGPSRFYEFFLSSGQPFLLIANDGNLLPAPVARPSIRMGVAERMDVIIDFSQYPIGSRIYLENRLEQRDGRGPTGRVLHAGVPLLRFDVDRDAEDSPPIPAALRPLPIINPQEAVRTRSWVFERRNGAWQINRQFWNVNVVRADPRQGTAEIWNLHNNSGGWWHPIHIHLEEFRILTRNGRAPQPHEAGRKDVVVLGPNERVRVFLRFRDFLGRYPMHCHNTVHEDHAMMLRWDVVS
jgi:FtsP/CotA-like multicopper oxidase with cupredoxin domain